MVLSSINIDFFRNLNSTQLEFADDCNIFYGENGSGKTSLLEAIHYLILGRSFRTHILERIIQYNQDNLSIFGKIYQPSGIVTIGISRSKKNGKKIKVAGKEASSILEVTKLAPIQVLNHDSYLFLHEGPKIRRQFIDWGLFHVEHQFLNVWRKVERILSQRNRAIRNKMGLSHIKAWDKEYATFGRLLYNYRNNYIKNLIPILQEILQDFLENFSVDIRIIPGWNTGYELEEFLANNIKNDLKFGYTTAGPHRTDLKVLINGVPAKDILSRGQQKLLLYGLQIARGKLINQIANKKCIYLIDDLLAELDMNKCQILARTILNIKKSQLFVTGLDPQTLQNIFTNSANQKSFAINQGIINITDK